MSKKDRTSTRLQQLAGVTVDFEQELPDNKPDARKKGRGTEKLDKSAKPKETNASAKVEPKAKDKPSQKSAKSRKKENCGKTSPTKTAKKQENDEQRKPCTTAQVMKLVERTADVNPVLLAGKSRVPSRLRGKESLTRIMRRDLVEEFNYNEDTVVVNLTELAIENEAPIILDRFNACSCDKCVEIFSRIIAEKVPVRFARVNKNGRGADNRDLSERISPMRKIVLTEMIRELIGSKKRCFHDDTE